jgi:DNA primase
MIAPTAIEQIKEQIDCRHLIAHYLGLPAHGAEGSKAWSWRCPMHQESKGHSLTAWNDGWKCWGACNTGGDAIAWLRVFSGLSFDDACHALGASDQTTFTSGGRKFARRVEHSLPKIAEPPDDDWQGTARRIVKEAQERLWSPEGTRAMEYLRDRGLYKSTILDAKLGYVPGHYTEYQHLRTLKGARFDVPCGILIPWITDGAIWGIKVRRAAGDLKYVQVAGGNISGGSLYWADDIVPGWPILFTEGEFDALIIWQEALDLVCPVTLGACSNNLNPRWYPILSTSPLLLTLYDADEAGDKGAARLAALTPRTKRIYVPKGKDATDYNRFAGMRGIYKWLDATLNEFSTERNAA